MWVCLVIYIVFMLLRVKFESNFVIEKHGKTNWPNWSFQNVFLPS